MSRHALRLAVATFHAVLIFVYGVLRATVLT